MTTPRRLTLRPVRPTGWWFDGLCLAAFVALTAVLAAGGLLRLDLAVRDWADAHRPGWADILFGQVLNRLGNGTPLALICLGVALLRIWRRRDTVRLVLPVLGGLLVTGLTLGPLKLWTERGAPHHGPVSLFSAPDQQSYPSGHMVNTLVWYAVLALLLWPWLAAPWRRVLRTAPVVIVGFTTVYTGFHWLSDTVAGVLLGLPLARLIVRIPWEDLPLPGRLAAWDAARVDTAAPDAAPLDTAQ